MASALTALDAVRARIAAALAPQPADAALGAFRLHEYQRRQVTAIERALNAYGGALVADAPGSGKTLLALAVARRYPEALVLAPATLRAQWEMAGQKAGVRLRFASLEALSRGREIRGAPLVIVDEAHHLRSSTTARYRHAADLLLGCHALLLSATPVVNRPQDRDALLALFLGARAAALPATVLERVVLRQGDRPPLHAAVRQLPLLPTAAAPPGLAAAIVALPLPFPAADGRSAAALVRLTLAMAWGSSLAALDRALRRRLQRGQVLVEQLEAGRWPTRDVLRDWLHGDDASQLALPLARPTSAREPSAEALPMVQRHLDAVRALRDIVTPAVERDTQMRANALRELLSRECPRRIVLLGQYAETIRALYRALRSTPGVVAITGERVLAAAGRWSRDEVLAALGPGATPWRADDPRGIRLLLATDLLAEGVELQGCATVVHADTPWTPARLEQRLGRVARVGQTQPVHETRFQPPRGLEELLRLQRRLQDKRRARHESLSASRGAAALQAFALQWQAAVSDDAPRVAAAAAADGGFIALLERGNGGFHIVAARHGPRGWQLSTRAAWIHSLLRDVGEALPVHPQCVRTARRILVQWQRRSTATRALRGVEGLPAALVRRVHARITEWLDGQSLARRAQAASDAAALLERLRGMRGAAAERVVAAALRRGDPQQVVARLREIAGRPSPRRAHATGPLRISALLLLHRPAPAAPAPPSACSGTAAPR